MTRLEVDVEIPESGECECKVRVVQECTTPRKQRANEAWIADGIKKYVIELLNCVEDNFKKGS